jgi:hypothetical protein
MSLIAPALYSLRLTRKAASALLSTANRHPRTCVACGRPVTDGDPFIRYRGEYYHAHGCAETDPPALRERRARERAAVESAPED